MTKEYEKYLLSYVRGILLSENDFEKVISLFPNIEIDWNEIFDLISDYEYSDVDSIIRHIIYWIIDYKLYVIDYYQDNSIDVEINDDDLTIEEINQIIDKLSKLGFVINNIDSLYEDIKDNIECEKYSKLRKKLCDKVQQCSYSELEEIYNKLIK